MSGMRSSAVVVTIAAVIAGLGAAGSAQAAQTDRLSTSMTSVSVRALQPSVEPGHRSTIAGNLQVGGAPGAGRPLVLEAQASGEQYFTAVSTAITGERGGVRVTVRPEVTTRYRWNYAGANDARPRISGVVVVRMRTSPPPPVVRRPTSLSVRAAYPSVTPGDPGLVGGTLLAGKDTPLRGKYVVLLSRTSPRDAWEQRQRRRTGRTGHVNFRVWPATRTYYRLAFARTATLEPARSGVVQIGIRQTVSIAATPREITLGDSTLITGTVTHVGSPVAGLKVDLIAQVVGSQRPWAVVETATTATDGSVSIEVSPKKSTRYRLRTYPATGLPQGSSRTVQVVVRAAATTDYRAADTGTQFAD